MRYNKIGTPYKVIQNDTDYTVYTSNITYKERPISYKKMNKVFEETLKDPFKDDSYIYLLSCDYNNIIPQLAAKAVEKSVLERGRVCYWYNVIRNHKSEDEALKNYIQEYCEPDLLIIDGAYTKTNVNNIDKIRELLSLFDNIPIYVIISGGVGTEFFTTQVFSPFNKFIHFGDTPRRKVTTL